MVPEGDDWTGNAVAAEVVTDPTYGAKILHATFADGEAQPVLEVVSRFRSRDRAGAGAVVPLSDAERQLYLAPTELMPTDGIVQETADEITAGAEGDEAKARAIYEWVVENTSRNGATRGCGIGDVASMLASGNLSGKCADLNALYVALARASGVPARDLYGIRVAPSAFGYKSLGAKNETITKSQHCRAEVWLAGKGWTPVDPADVRKVVLEEPPGENALDSEVVVAASEKLFGAWEGNWMPYNAAHDIVLPGSAHKVAFLMYPQAEVAGALLDCLDPDTFGYAITAAELTPPDGRHPSPRPGAGAPAGSIAPPRRAPRHHFGANAPAGGTRPEPAASRGRTTVSPPPTPRGGASGGVRVARPLSMDRAWHEPVKPRRTSAFSSTRQCSPIRPQSPQRSASGSTSRASSRSWARVSGWSGRVGWRTASERITPPSFITTLHDRQPHWRFSKLMIGSSRCVDRLRLVPAPAR